MITAKSKIMINGAIYDMAKFKEKFNIVVNVYDKSNELYIPSKEFVKFRNLIEQYIEPSMAYKLGPSKTA